ncbi:hypothetical protein FA95DRAFT_1520503 [Auriscalpium vulgare]|uniref:Uncharacterized protein n=1 Tax=Auriscalpium vulgare TaxID=40419 RepID=A0ACB8RQK3_9AGAM|nr:hypothetical protein FA95DRAFT_1520503 [Auriscalpium vulgare]
MGFLQRFLSLGSKKNKKRRAPLEPCPTGTTQASNSGDRRKEEHDSEAAASRLLRSSSSHFAVVSEVDYASLPPIPHPINSLQVTPRGSPSRAASVQSRRTFTVKVHDRQVLARTEFPNANPPLDTPKRTSKSPGRRRIIPPITPRDKNRLHTLRQDPSVASLLDMYDAHGHLDSKVFSNTPPADPEKEKDGRTQVKRSGSTLRQLLGNPEPGTRNSTTEGDISWAERFLQEDDIPYDAQEAPTPTSTNSSFGFETPQDAIFDDEYNVHLQSDEASLDDAPVKADTAFTFDDDPSLNESEFYPAISSMEVELSTATVDTVDLPTDYLSTPHRAAEVFGFLLDKDKDKRRSHAADDRPLPALPTSADSSTDSISPYRDTNHLHPATPPFDDSPSKNTAADHSGSVEAPSSAGSLLHDPPLAATIIMNRTPVLTATAVLKEGPRVPPSRIPRGPRGPVPAAHDMLADAPDARTVFRTSTNASAHANLATAIGLGPRKATQRSGSYGSSDDTRASRFADGALVTPVSMKPARIRAPLTDDTKENGHFASLADLSQTTPLLKTRLPVTPARSRALFDPPHGATPSPASSSELSPIAAQMMANLRKQRSRAGSRKKNRLAEVTTYS